MSWLLIVLLHIAITIIKAAPSPAAGAPRTLPSCFPTRPHCIRPRVDECRDAISLMGNIDPGYPVILSRPECSEGTSRSYSVPHAWASVPKNCVVKLDVTDPKASDELFIKSLTIPAELVIRKCIIGGTGCGGSILVGKAKVLELTLAYYTAVEVGSSGYGVLTLDSNEKYTKLLDWYGKLSTRRVDLVGDYAGQELFIVEGDGLLLRCFDDLDLDFSGMFCLCVYIELQDLQSFDRSRHALLRALLTAHRLTDGFQLLHAVYAVEHFLQGLLQRKCVFHIVFFDVHQHLCIPRATPSAFHEKYLLARAVIMRHLTLNLPNSHPAIEVFKFESALDHEFQEYLAASGAYFIMTHDGANPVPLEKDPRLLKNDGLDLEILEHEDLQRRAALRTTIFYFINHGYNVALIDGLEWMDTKIMTMVVEGTRGSNTAPKVDKTVFEHQPEQAMHESSRPEDDLSASDLDLLLKEMAKEGVVTERVLLTVTTLHIILKRKLGDTRFAMAMLIHMLLITKTDLSSRYLQRSSFKPKEQSILDDFLVNFARISRRILEGELWKDRCAGESLSCDISDLVDGRLFANVSLEQASRPIHQIISQRLLQQFQRFVKILSTTTGISEPFPGRTSSELLKSPVKKHISDSTASVTILPFSNAIFDKHLKSISLSAKPPRDPSGKSVRVFRELSHWHNAKRRLDPKASHALSDREKGRALRRNQFFMAEMAGYAASLTGVTGKILEPELITTSESGKATDTVEQAKENTNVTKQRKGPTGKGTSSAKAIVAANIAAKGGGIADKAMAAWKVVRTNLDAERQLQSRYRKTRAYLRDLTDEKRTILEAEVQYYILVTLLKMYRILCKQNEINTPHQIDGVAALLFSTIRELTVAKGLTKTITSQVKSVIAALKLPDVDFPPTEADRKLSFESDLRLNEVKPTASSIANFQLQHCGPYMDRNLDSAPDPRVKGFHPDGWQRKVLDELDADRSIFVVAPTSAGKTFISFYAMEKVLRRNDDSVLVYVAPTKALVNQIGAEIQARFKKGYKHAGRSVWAIHTRDYRINNPSGCQILVTVPHILQIMLLSPSNAKSWCRKVKCIIFDEIHCIGQAEDGVVWEQLLLLAPCPIIALSATVGNPDQFNSWLESTQQSSGFDLTMITHQHRFSDLRKFVYQPPKRFAFNGLPEPAFATLGLDGVDGLTFLHPVASLVNKSRGMPQDLSLEARDCLLLWQAMTRYQTKAFPVDEKLNPNHLPQVIRKAHIIEWEKQLKALLGSWMSQEQSPFDKVVEELGKPVQDSSRAHSYKSRLDEASMTTEDAPLDLDDLTQTTLPLLCKLQERDALPAILFNYDRGKCENICKAVMKQLVDAEAAMKESSPAWKSKMKGYEQYLKNKSKQTKKVVEPKKKGKANDDEGMSKADKMQDAASEEVNPYANFNPDAPVEGFHFANIAKAEAAELAAIHRELNRRGLQPWLMDSLTRGIGVHHAGMNRKYRQAVEMLFRKGFLRVVIATGTLALGINMPCATVVFSGDSVFLTALNYRQAAGRAGRRGFDLLGNVVFQNIATAKVCRLLSSRLPDLTGHFPVTTTLILRLFTLLHESGHSKYAVDAVNSLLSQPRLYLDGPSFKDQVLHHLRFSIEYLRRHDLLSAEGVPLNFAGLTSHLYYTENSSFTLNALIKEGYFHDLCSEIDTAESRVLRTLMIVLAHLFGRRPCKHSDQEYIEEIVKRSPSVVFLPPLPASASRILQRHNRQTLDIFTTYVRTFVDQHIHTPDHTLPLTGLSVGAPSDNNEEDTTPPASFLPPPSSAPKIRSPFVALSGHNDTFPSIPSLCRTVRSGVFLEESVIPHLDVYPDESDTPLNAYLYDFYMHGDIDALERANGVRKSDVWFLLNDFSLVLATIMTSLAGYMKIPDVDAAGNMEDLVGGGDEGVNKEEEALETAAADSGYGSAGESVSDLISSVSEIGLGGKGKDKGKKKVVEEDWEMEADKQQEEEEEEKAWDDDDDDDDSEEEEEQEQPKTVKEMEKGFLDIYKAFSKLKKEFDEKFRAMFA
ncbi:MAG: hypothetical protein Q9216_003685 [Gyalolechia sp. 2 TL-2023]